MSTPVTVNDLSPISGSIQTSRISYAVEPAGKNYGQNYGGKNWYSDIPNDGTYYTIVSDNYTANYYTSRSQAGGGYVEGGIPAVDEYSAPVFWITTGTSSANIIDVVNGLPDRIDQVAFVSGAAALEWVASSSNYFAIGPDFYRDIDADNMSFFLHGGQIISYPTTGSKWYDLSGVGTINMNLYNNPTYNDNGWIIFDGSDDYGEADAIITPSTGAFSVEFLYRIDSSGGRGGLFERNDTSPYNGWSLGQGGTGIWALTVADNLNNDSVQADWTYPTLGTWYHDIGTYNGSNNVKAYRNGVEVDSTTGTAQGNLDISGSREPLRILKRDAGSSVISGSVAVIRIYPKELTAEEVAQNYYGGPIVTSGLQLVVDAGNLVSYPKSGTSLYDLTGNSRTGTLTNGPTFSSRYGGGIVLDGTDDWITFGNQGFLSADFTMDIWFELNNNSKEHYIFTTGYNTAGSFLFYSNGLAPVAGFWDGASLSTYGMGTVSLDTPVNITITRQGAEIKIYQDGNLTHTHSNSLPLNPGTYSLGWATPRNKATAYMEGVVYSLRLYDRPLSADEVLQNYNATN